MCNHSPNREAAMVKISPGVWCDPCIESLIRALNDGGVRTVASCCGHHQTLGNIALADGRQLFIAASFDEAALVSTALHEQQLCTRCGEREISHGYDDVDHTFTTAPPTPEASAHNDDIIWHGDPIAGEGDTRTDPYLHPPPPDEQRCEHGFTAWHFIEMYGRGLTSRRCPGPVGVAAKETQQ